MVYSRASGLAPLSTIPMMLSNTMTPAAYNHGGKLAGVITIRGFAVSATFEFLGRA